MKNLFGSNLFILISIIILSFLSLYREWETGSLAKGINGIFCNKKLKNGKKVSIRQPDIFIYYILYRFLDYLFRGIVLRHFLSQQIIFPLAIAISLFLHYKYPALEAQDLILFITFMALLWYSKETFEMRKSQNQANKIAKKFNG